MLAKMTSKNQITIPQSVIKSFKGVQYFQVEADNGHIILNPIKLNSADAVRTKLASMHIKTLDIENAIAWSRRSHK